MKNLWPILLALIFFACSQPADETQVLKARVDQLEKALADTYKPGFGEFMSGIQAHHMKLWFAGQNQNWALADFEVHEIMEALDDIQKFQSERPESKLIGILNPALDSVNTAIRLQNATLFKTSYQLLTNTCNSCHSAAKFEFNVVKIPEQSPFSNQDFTKK